MARYAVLRYGTPIFRRGSRRHRRRSHGPAIKLIKRHRVFHFNINLILIDKPEMPVPLAVDASRRISAGIQTVTRIARRHILPLHIRSNLNSPARLRMNTRLDCVRPLREGANILATIHDSPVFHIPLWLECSERVAAGLAIGSTLKRADKIPVPILAVCSESVAAGLAIGTTLRHAPHIPTSMQIACSDGITANVAIGATLRGTSAILAAVRSVIARKAELPTPLRLTVLGQAAANVAIGSTLKHADQIHSHIRIRCLDRLDTRIRLAADISERASRRVSVEPQMCVLVDPADLAALLT